MKIVFMGSPEFAVPTLETLINSKHEIIAVYSQPPRPSGRGQKVNKTAVHKLADKYNIPVFTPEKLNNIHELQELKPDLICVVAYGLILPENVLNIAPCINLHPSSLPRWRGAAPMNYPILHGETETDICIMKMETGLDTGPVYLRKHYEIGENETAGELHDRFKIEGAKYMLEVASNWDSFKEKHVIQQGDTCYAHKFKSEELEQVRKLDFSKTAAELHNQVRGLSPWPGALCMHNETEIKVLNSILSHELCTNEVGTICELDANGIHVNTTVGCLCLTKLQRSGKNAMLASEFLKGYPLTVGDKLA